ncbi:MAG: class I SAM-dependent methyltransferase [Anaerolineae bacterium]|nr:class I SAM-dependent methyltransferase [Anaerolineae bacterium]
MSHSAELAYVKRQYAAEDNLAIRIRTHKLYTEPKLDFVAWVLDHINWRGDEVVLDVGCGSGNYVAATRPHARHYVANDFSFGMLSGLEFDGLERVNLNAEKLPYASNSADVILANHMIYHIMDAPAAVREFRRVLRQGGTLLAATNSRHSMAELDTILQAATQRLGAQPLRTASSVLTFTLENGAALLEQQFANVTCDVLDAAFVFPEAQPVIDYLSTTRERHVARLPAGVTWNDLVVVLTELVQSEIDEHGAFRVNKQTGVFVCK